MIKQKLQSTWNWLKEKVKKFKKWIIALLIPVAFAAPIVFNDGDGWVSPENCFVVSERNYDGIQHEKLRKKIDYVYNGVHDELSNNYYCYWQYGQSKPFQGYDVLLTKEESKKQFDKLQALIWAHYEDFFDKENKKQKTEDIIPEREYNDILDRDGNVIDKRSNRAKNRIKELKDEGYEIQFE